MRKIVILFLCFVNVAYSGDSLLIPKLFQSLLNKQQLETQFFVEGSFTSFRQHNNSENLQADNNIFFTALIAYTLQDIKPYLTATEKIVADTIINRAKIAFTFYKNKKGRLSYNFWRTDNGKNFFPNDAILSHFKNKLSLADDLDDTSIILLALNSNDSTNQVAHELMQQYVNGKFATIKNTYEKYKNVKAYSTWYGVKMPIDFDFGVHCNILSFVNKYNLPWQKADSATYNLLLNMMDENLYVTDPKYISAYYGYSPVLMYHIARLMHTKPLADLEKRKPNFINNAMAAFNSTDNVLYKILLATSLLKCNVNSDLVQVTIPQNFESLNTTDFIYYTGHLFAHLNNSIKSIANATNATQYKWFSSAYNNCLLLEYLILKYRKAP